MTNNEEEPKLRVRKTITGGIVGEVVLAEQDDIDIDNDKREEQKPRVVVDRFGRVRRAD